MPDSAAHSARSRTDSAGLAPAKTDADTQLDADTKPARAARSAQRPAVLIRAPYGAPTLDLFAEDAERATLQALNTDIRQTTLPGFELPDVFMAAVSATCGMDEQSMSLRAARRAVLPDESSSSSDNTASRNDPPSLELRFDDIA
jgi:hypothetical protein